MSELLSKEETADLITTWRTRALSNVTKGSVTLPVEEILTLFDWAFAAINAGGRLNKLEDDE